MLPTLITDAPSILKNQKRLERELKERGIRFESFYATRGLPQGVDHEAFYFEKLKIYWKSGDYNEVNRYWNTFGVGKPGFFKDAFQVNIPKEGINRRVSGAFLTSGAELFLLHRGPLGGGRKDGGNDIRSIVPTLVQAFDDDGRHSEGIIIPFLDSKGDFHADFLPQMKTLVHEVARKLGRE